MVAIAVLALGIGANTAIFSIADAVLFRAPHVHNAHELAVVYTTCRRGAERCSSSYHVRTAAAIVAALLYSLGLMQNGRT